MNRNNKIRKFLGMLPQSEKSQNKDGKITITDYYPDFSVKETTEYKKDGKKLIKDGTQTFFSEQGVEKSTKTYADDVIQKESYYDKDGTLVIKDYKNGELCKMTEHHHNGGCTVSEIGNCYTLKTHTHRNGSVTFKDRLYNNKDNLPATNVLGTEGRRSYHIEAYINGYRIGPVIGGGKAYNPKEEIESVRQNTLFNMAKSAKASGDNGLLEEITAQALKQKELLDTPEFQEILKRCYEETKATQSTKDIKKFQADFYNRLEQSGYQQLNPENRTTSSLKRVRQNLETNKETTEAPKEEAKEEVIQTAQYENPSVLKANKGYSK